MQGASYVRRVLSRNSGLEIERETPENDLGWPGRKGQSKFWLAVVSCKADTDQSDHVKVMSLEYPIGLPDLQITRQTYS